MPIVVLFKSCCIYWFLQLQRANTIFTKHPNIDDLGRNDSLITFTWQGLCIGLRKWKKNTICGGNDHIVYARLLRFVCPGENNIIQTPAGPNNSISQLKTSAGNVCFSTQPATRESEIPSTANNPPPKKYHHLPPNGSAWKQPHCSNHEAQFRFNLVSICRLLEAVLNMLLLGAASASWLRPRYV